MKGARGFKPINSRFLEIDLGYYFAIYCIRIYSTIYGSNFTSVIDNVVSPLPFGA